MPRCSPRSRETAPLTAAALHGTARLTGEQEKNDQIARAEVAGRNLARPLTRPTSISVGCGSSGGTSRCLWDDVLGVAGLVDAVTFLGEVVAPVVVEVAVAGDGAQFEDGLCAG